MFSWIAKTWNSVTTKISLFFGTDINNPNKAFLHSACYYDDFALVEYLLARGIDINGKNADNNTALFVSLMQPTTEMAEFLLGRGANIALEQRLLKPLIVGKYIESLKLALANGYNPNEVYVDNETAIYYAIRNHNLEAFKILQIYGAKFDYVSKKGETLLHVASEDMSSAITILIAQGLDVKKLDAEGRSPINHAIAANNMFAVYELQKLGGKLDLGSKADKALLTLCVKNSYASSVEFLLRNNANPNHSVDDKYPPIFYAIIKDPSPANKNILDLLIKYGADVNFVDANGKNLLHHAAINTNGHGVQELLKLHVELNVKDKDGKTALFYALNAGDKDICKQLYRAGDRIDMPKQADSIFLNAIDKNFVQIVEFMVREAGFKFNSSHQTYVIACLNQKKLALADTFVRLGVNLDINRTDLINAFHNSVLQNDLEVAQYLVAKGMNVNTLDAAGHTSLYNAIMNGSCEMTKILLGAGVKVNVPDSKTKSLPLELAMMNDNINIFKLLLSARPDVNAKTQQGQALLDIAIDKGNWQYVDALVKNQAKINYLSATYGKTPLMKALECGQMDIAELLIRYGADLSMRDPQTGSTALHYAAYYGSYDVVKLMIVRGANLQIKNDEGYTAADIASLNHRDTIAMVLMQSSKDYYSIYDHYSAGDNPLYPEPSAPPFDE